MNFSSKSLAVFCNVYHIPLISVVLYKNRMSIKRFERQGFWTLIPTILLRCSVSFFAQTRCSSRLVRVKKIGSDLKRNKKKLENRNVEN